MNESAINGSYQQTEFHCGQKSDSSTRGSLARAVGGCRSRRIEEVCVWGLALCAVNPSAVEGMGMVVNDPPTRAEVQAIAEKLDELLAVLKR